MEIDSAKVQRVLRLIEMIHRVVLCSVDVDVFIPTLRGRGRGQVRDPDRLTYNLDEEEADDIQSDEEY